MLAALVAGAALAVWFQRSSLDGVQGIIGTVLLGEDTAYAGGYTDRAFRLVRVGMTNREVQSLLGPPLGVTWTYQGSWPQECISVYFRTGRAEHVFDACQKLGIRTGSAINDVEELLGRPDGEVWMYSESPSDTHYRQRIVRFANGQVIEVIKGWYLD